MKSKATMVSSFSTNNRIFISLIHAVIAYEWLVSGFNKLLSGEFVVGLHDEILASIPDMKYPFYAHFLEKWCVPHCDVLGGLIIFGEISVGLLFVFLGIVMLRGNISPVVMGLGAITALAGVFMNLNFFFFEGGAFFLQTSEPFDEGVSIDFLLVLFQLGLAVYYLSMFLSYRRVIMREADQGTLVM